MNISERDAVRFVAKLAPWIAPVPSAFFVARSSIVHLAMPISVAVIVAVIVETLGLSTVNITLHSWEWNETKRKTDPAAPTAVGVILGIIYLVTTLGLIVALEVWPDMATIAPAMFPFLAVVGTVNLALISGQDRREAAIVKERAERKAERQAKHDANDARIEAERRERGANKARIEAETSERDANIARTVDKDAFIVAYRANGHESIAALAREMRVNPRTAQKWVAGTVDKDERGELRGQQ